MPQTETVRVAEPNDEICSVNFIDKDCITTCETVHTHTHNITMHKPETEKQHACTSIR